MSLSQWTKQLLELEPRVRNEARRAQEALLVEDAAVGAADRKVIDGEHDIVWPCLTTSFKYKLSANLPLSAW